MKNLKILFVFLAAVAFFASCGNETEYEAPKISFTPTTNPVVAEFTDGVYNVNVQYTIVAEAKIKTIAIERYDDGDINNAISGTLTDAVNGDRNETEFTFSMTDALLETAFNNNIRYKVIVTDQQDQVTSSEYHVLKTAETYQVTFTVKADASTVISGATVSINSLSEVTDDNGQVTFNLAAGTYEYTVEKENYNPATGSITVSSEAVTENVTLTASTTSLSNWSSDITIEMLGTNGYAYGLAYTTNGDGSSIHIDAYSGAEFVELTSEDYSTVQDLKAAFDAGTKITKILQPFTFNPSAKDYSPKYFISRVGDVLYLIKTTNAVVHTTNGNFVKFQEKH